MQPHHAVRHRILGVAGLNAALVLALLLPSGAAEPAGTTAPPAASGTSASRTLDDAAPVAFSYKVSTKYGNATTKTTVARQSHASKAHRYKATSKATRSVSVTAIGTTTVSRSATERFTAPDGSVLTGSGTAAVSGSQKREVTKKVTVTVTRTGKTKAAAAKAARDAAVKAVTSKAKTAATSAAVAAVRTAATEAATKGATAKAQGQAHDVLVAALARWKAANWRSYPDSVTLPAKPAPTTTTPPTTSTPPAPAPTTTAPTTTAPSPTTSTPPAPAPTTTTAPVPAIWAMKAAADNTSVADVKSWDCTDGSGRYTSAITDSQHSVAQQFQVGASGRCEASPSTTFTEGQDRWFEFSTYLAPGFAVNTAWQVLAQWKNDGAGSPPLSLTVQTGGDNFAFDGGFGHPDGPKQWQVPVGKVVTGQWVDWKMHVVFSTTPSKALLEVWRDGSKVISGYHPISGTLYPARASNGTNPNGATSVSSYLKYGIYRSSTLTNPTWVGQSNWIVASSEAALTR